LPESIVSTKRVVGQDGLRWCSLLPHPAPHPTDKVTAPPNRKRRVGLVLYFPEPSSRLDASIWSLYHPRSQQRGTCEGECRI